MSDPSSKSETHGIEISSPFQVLNPPLVDQIDQALKRVGAFGEVRLVVVKGRLRFIQVMQSQVVDGGGAKSV